MSRGLEVARLIQQRRGRPAGIQRVFFDEVWFADSLADTSPDPGKVERNEK